MKIFIDGVPMDGMSSAFGLNNIPVGLANLHLHIRHHRTYGTNLIAFVEEAGNGSRRFRQTMSNWIIRCAEKYFAPFVDRMKEELLSLPVTQSDETPAQVIGDSDRPNSKCYMWVHRSGEFYKERPVVIYEYQKGRDHEKPLEFYRNYKGVRSGSRGRW